MHAGTNGSSAHQVGDLCASPDLVWLELDMEDGDSWLSSPSHGRGQTWLLGGLLKTRARGLRHTAEKHRAVRLLPAPTTSLLCSRIRE